MLENYYPPFNATVVEKLFDSGVTLMGKTNMDEFAMGSACSESYFGAAYNPWNSSLNCKFCLKLDNPETVAESKPIDDKDCWFITGGSSGGSAVSVATGACFASISSDTGGSTRNPASRLGIVGFKPSYGLISRYGLIPLTHSLDVPGIMARNVNDVRLVFTSLHGHDPRDSTTVDVELEDDKNPDLNNLTVGIPVEYDVENLSPNISKAWKEAEYMLRDAGARIKQISLPHTKYSLACYSILNSSEVASNFACYDGIEYGYRTSQQDLNFEDLYISTREEALNDIVKSRIIAGNYFLL
ncbi:glutamyl-tRNA(Gln) amidotransferase subunit A, mitochondrial-like, partial [Euroglyphus maynei]